VVDGVVDGQADQAGVRRYSDDHHIVRELDEPPPPDWAATLPAPVAGAGPDTREWAPGTRPSGPLTRPGPGSGPPNRGR
jgi:hypothetical protein